MFYGTCIIQFAHIIAPQPKTILFWSTILLRRLDYFALFGVGKKNYQSAYHSNQLNWNSFGKNDADQSWQLFIFGHCLTNKGNHYLSADQPYIVHLGFMLLQYNTQLNPGNKIGLSHWVIQTSRAISLRTLGHRCPRKLLVNRDMSR